MMIVCCRRLSVASRCFHSCVRASHTSAHSSRDVTATVTYECSGDVCLIGLNRPHKRNAVDLDTGRQLARASLRFNRDDNLRVAVLYGHGAHFCAGFDLSELSESGQQVADTLKQCADDVSVRPMGLTGLLQLDKPILAAVQGYCVAGGLELALACDLRIVDKSAIFGVFCRRFGVPLIDGGTVRLPQMVGFSRAMDMILTGRPIDADTAMQWGLANRITDRGTGAQHFVDGAGRGGSFRIGRWTGNGYDPTS